MIVAILLGTVIGFVLAIPPGPIGMAAIRTGMRQGWGAAMKLSIGAGLFDLVYCALAMLATSAVVNALDSVEQGNPLVTIILQLVIVVAMIVFGIVMFRERPVTDEDVPLKSGRKGPLAWFQSHGPFFVGVGFAIANLANPTFIPALAAMTTSVQNLELYASDTTSDMAFAVGFGAGNVLWLFTLVRLVLHYRDKMTPVFLRRIQQVSGLTLIGFGTYFGFRILAVARWADITKMLFAL
ncbi:MAG TPA: hypothetical protein DIS79_07365 [Bacteroidetes bacterium]|nr:hypothetical protein [Bacteroidota bacterium]HRK03890.1 LysE family transporter [Chlorobiota bacterium]